MRDRLSSVKSLYGSGNASFRVDPGRAVAFEAALQEFAELHLMPAVKTSRGVLERPRVAKRETVRLFRGKRMEIAPGTVTIGIVPLNLC